MGVEIKKYPQEWVWLIICWLLFIIIIIIISLDQEGSSFLEL